MENLQNNFFQNYSDLTTSIRALTKDEKNPFFKSNYVSLASILEEAKRVCLENNFIFLQTPKIKDGKEILITELRHISGEKISCEMPLVRKELDDPQKLGASLTYMRRYSLTSILGIQETDDDGNNAAGKAEKKEVKKDTKQEQKLKIKQLADQIDPILQKAEDYQQFVREKTDLELLPENYPQIINKLKIMLGEET